MCVRGGPQKFCQGFPPLLRDVQEGGWAGHAGGPGGHSLGQGGAQKILLGVPPLIVCVWGDLQMFFQGFPLLLRGMQERGGLTSLVARAGACWVGAECRTVFEGFLPWIVCVQGALQFFCQGFPPLLRGMREVRTQVGLVARMGTRLVESGGEVALSHLVARSPPRGRGVRQNFCGEFVPGEVGVPKSVLKIFHGSSPRV